MTFDEFWSATICERQEKKRCRELFERIPEERHGELADAMAHYEQHIEAERRTFPTRRAMFAGTFLGMRRGGRGWENWTVTEHQPEAEVLPLPPIHARARAIVAHLQRELDRWDLEAAAHVHGGGCRDGELCPYVLAKRPREPVLEEVEARLGGEV